MVKKVKKTCAKKAAGLKREQNKKCTDCNEWLWVELQQDPELALGYLNETILDEDQMVFFVTLKDVVMSQKWGVTEVVKKTGLNRQNLYRMLFMSGNPS